MKPLLKNWLFNIKMHKFYCNIPLSSKAKGLFAFFIFLIIYGHAQINLVPNPSFEIYTTCPSASGQINSATPWTGTSGGEEYFNSCSAVYSVPFQNYGSAGFQYARTGNAFAALFMLNGYGSNYREYLQVQLNDTLQNSKCYLVSFYANLQNPINIAVNNLGLYVSNTLFTTTSPFGVPPYTPQILRYKNKIVSDTLNWTMISGIYTAIGGEKYISIGNFYDDSNTDTLQTGDGTIEAAYYYIDDVSVTPIDSIIGGMPAFAGNDTSVMSGDSVFIGQQISNLNCNWYNSSGTLIASNTSGVYVHPTSNTFYTVQQNLCGTITYDTVNVNVNYVGIEENSWIKKINIYPNPSSGAFMIELPDGNTSYKIRISDIQGRIIYQEITDSKKLSLTPEVENGIYLIHITKVTSNETVVKKLIIQK